VNYSSLLNWAISTGRIDAGARSRFASLLGGRDASEVEAALLDAQANPALGDFLPPLPWGIGDPADSATVETATVAAAAGRKVLASQGASGFEGALRPGDVDARPMVAAATSSGLGAPAVASKLAGMIGGIEMEIDLGAPSGPPPPLFAAGGDVPLITASGVDPDLLRKLPPEARHAAAQAETRAEAFAIFEAYGGGGDGVLAAQVDALDGGPLTASLADYRARYATWASTPATIEEAPDA
jgi:hypothetical protein